MKIVTFVNTLGLGGTEKAACRWARGLKERGHEVAVITLIDGPRRSELTTSDIPISLVPKDPVAVATELERIQPDAIHAHVPGQPHMGDVLGAALKGRAKIPVVQTNIFGVLQNPAEDAWTDFRLFISWTSCVQAAQRASRKLDETFFRRSSVAVYPVDAETPAAATDTLAFRQRLGVKENEILFGRLARPDPNKWTHLAVDAFQIALRRNRTMKLLLREPPPLVAEALRKSPDASHFIILPATPDPAELRLTMSALDAVLHTSSIGESFGYGVAEPMNLGKPVVTHSVPWHDQAQIELVRDGECGYVASTPDAMAEAILRLAADGAARQRMGIAAQKHIRQVANAETSISRLEAILQAARTAQESPFIADDLTRARATANYIAEHQFGHSLAEKIALRSGLWRARFHHWRKGL